MWWATAFTNCGKRAFGASAAVVTDALRRDAIAVQNLAHFARREEKIIAAVVRHEKSEAVRMALDGAGHKIELRRDAKLTLAIPHDEAGAFELRNLRVEWSARLLRDAEPPHEIVERNGHACGAERREDLVARRGCIGIARSRAARCALHIAIHVTSF